MQIPNLIVFVVICWWKVIEVSNRNFHAVVKGDKHLSLTPNPRPYNEKKNVERDPSF
jgi:hypothetical protein